MDQEKFLQLQMQMRQNNDDYKNFLDGMESWSSEIKVKEKTLISESNNSNSFQIRNASNRKKSKPKQEKIKAYDYKSWDKFDVDKALEEFDKEDKSEDGMNEEDNVELANKLKDLGNLRFKEGNYQAAISEYSRAMEYNPLSDVLFTNRAMCLIKLGDYDAAEIDCTEAIRLDDSAVKAYYRRAKCRTCLNRRDDALEDLRVVMKIEPGNKAARRELEELERELNIRGVVRPLDRPASGRESNRPLVRVPIVSVDPSRPFETPRLDVKGPEHQQQHTEEVAVVAPSAKCQDAPNPVFVAPKTSVHLSKDLARFRSNAHHLAAYVAGLSSKTYGRLIGHALDCEMLLDLINGLSQGLAGGTVEPVRFVDCVTDLHGVARFASSWFMISDADKAHYKQALALLDESLAVKIPFSI